MERTAIIVSFSSKIGGNCDQISTYIRTICGISAKIYRFTDFIIHPCGGCGYECFANSRRCPYIDDAEYRILEEICNSSITYFVLPNYCNFPCAHFFTFNERSQCFFQHHAERLEQYLNVPKRFVVVSNTGTENFIEALEQHTNKEPKILFLSAKHYGKVSIEGTILQSDAAKADLRRFIQTGDIQSRTPAMSV